MVNLACRKIEQNLSECALSKLFTQYSVKCSGVQSVSGCMKHQRKNSRLSTETRWCTMKVIKYSTWGNVGSPDVVTYFPRLIDKGNYTGGNMVTKVYEVARTERLNDCLSSIENVFTRNKSSNIHREYDAAATR